MRETGLLDKAIEEGVGAYVRSNASQVQASIEKELIRIRSELQDLNTAQKKVSSELEVRRQELAKYKRAEIECSEGVKALQEELASRHAEAQAIAAKLAQLKTETAGATASLVEQRKRLETCDVILAERQRELGEATIQRDKVAQETSAKRADLTRKEAVLAALVSKLGSDAVYS